MNDRTRRCNAHGNLNCPLLECIDPPPLGEGPVKENPPQSSAMAELAAMCPEPDGRTTLLAASGICTVLEDINSNLDRIANNLVLTRDKVAVAAMQGFCANRYRNDQDLVEEATVAYQAADELFKVLKTRRGR